MLIKSKPLLFILFISIIFLILFNSQKNKDGLDQSLELTHFYALQGRPDAQFELATRIEQAVQNQTELSDQQIFPKKLLDFSYQLFFDHPSAEPSVLDRFFEPIYSNSAEALAWYQVAAAQGHKDAQTKLANYYYNDGRGPHFEQAFPWISILAKRGDAFAQAQLGWLYFSGSGVEQNYRLAHQWFLKAGLKGNRSASAYLAWMYLHAQGTQGNNTEAFKWYEKAAQYGDEEAQMITIAMYKLGVGTEKNIEKSEYWKNKVKQTGDQNFDLHYQLNDYEYKLLYFAKINEENKDKYISNEFYQKYNLALDYKNSSDSNKQRAFEIFNELLASHKNRANVQYQIAEMYEKGVGTAKDIHKAIEFYKLAAAQNDVMALLRLGDLYFTGDVIAQDFTQALFWYRKIEALGQQHAHMKLGDMYMKGLGVAKDPKKAFQYYLPLAEQGHQEAMRIVAHCYENGIGTPQNLKKAQKIKAKLRI